eukprot:CAMPEP_0172645670 /NCGR_PEP_ID=MMETSP1068-20121228/239847_1 /TAXON_ID=35684 /ORGANISM="Pseudopedinella elastica, Strain CCMP716" /LENGTH=243 /DNA_ID=CAMNT_0013459915 /DNA_START=1005 /DNA_END=1736 /DNA_ORIENTATION=-
MIFAKCASEIVKKYKIQIIYVASDSPDLHMKTLVSYLRPLVSNLTLFSTFREFQNFTVVDGLLKPEELEPQSDLLESLMLGRGQVCVRTVRSTFSQVPSAWWDGQFCEVVVEVHINGPQNSTCEIQHMDAGRGSRNNSAIVGAVTGPMFGCNGWGCPHQPIDGASAYELRKACRTARHRQLWSEKPRSVNMPPKCCNRKTYWAKDITKFDETKGNLFGFNNTGIRFIPASFGNETLQEEAKWY